ncbi:MAG: glycoside hydrolase N-terminal domain-containing protein [Phycisphaerae bacterium]|nr:glycoside hydrolase N-terminal domain-containing protein [Phycisphaerae bacterium]
MTTEWKKTVVTLAIMVGLLWWRSSSALGTEGDRGGLLVADYAKLVSRADLHYNKPVSRSEEGIPIGNGRMGSLVWTTPQAIRLQINRVDVFANNSYTTSFPARNSDYCGGCAFVDIEFGADVFTDQKTSQHLFCYDGLADVRGDGVAANLLAWNEQDVMAFEVGDNRERPAAITAVLRMLRVPEVKTAAHTAFSKIESRDGRIILTQKFMEADYYCGSAVAVGIVGRKTKVHVADEREIQLVAEAKNGSFTVLIASAASFDPKEDIAAAALKQLAAAENKGYAALAESNKLWWHDFWSKGFIRLHSEDGIANYIEQNYTYYLYVTASSSRGRFPVKFNGMIWITGGDRRSWGGQYWGANQECMYNALFPTNRMELLDPMFDMYSGMYNSCSVATRQQWGSKGVYIPETVAFDGLARLPDDIAAEMRELYLLKKPWDQRTEKFLAVARTGQPHSSRWNWMDGGRYVDGVWRPTERGGGPYGPVTHIFSRGAKIAYTGIHNRRTGNKQLMGWEQPTWMGYRRYENTTVINGARTSYNIWGVKEDVRWRNNHAVNMGFPRRVVYPNTPPPSLPATPNNPEVK